MKGMGGLCLNSLKQMSDDYIEAEISNIVNDAYSGEIEQ